MARELGVAFSGGGIRSAAFCSGVLRRLIRKNAKPDYLSCVSGGGYTGSAYVEWKRRKGDTPETEWTNQFFDHMRKRAGYFCNWQNCCEGSCDSIILSALLFFVAIFSPIVGWGSFACPIAFIVKLFYGQFLDGSLCRENPDSKDCLERTILFSVSFCVLVLFHSLEYCCGENKWTKVVLKLVQMISGATFAFTFLPWFIEDFLQYSHVVIQLGIVGITAVFWFFVPILRKYSSLVILIYAYSYVVHWHLFEGKLFTIKYTKERFERCLFASLGVLAVFSVLGEIPRRFVHIYNRWRLQKAFYHHDEKAFYHCCSFCNCNECCSYEYQCCYCYDIFPGCHCLPCCCTSCMCPPSQSQADIEFRAVTLGDLKDIKPEYLSNMVVNGWRRKYKQKYCQLTMSSKGISVIDQQPEKKKNDKQNQPGPSTSSEETNQPSQHSEEKFREKCLNGKDFEKELKPSDIKLSSAMAMSAASFSPYLGKYETEEQQFTHILTLLGMDMAANLVYNMAGERRMNCFNWFAFYGINTLIVLLIGFGGFGLWKLFESYIHGLSVGITVGVVGGFVFLLAILLIVLYIWTCCDSCDSCEWNETGCTSTVRKWFVVHIPIYRFLVSILNFIYDGPNPPEMLHLSDGGHFENYGLLPLLKLRLPRILVVDGSHIESDDDYAKEIVHAMEHAREILDCSFTAINGSDVLTDIKNKYVPPKDGKFPRKYEFKVRYSDKDYNGLREGHIVLIAPRSLPTENSSSVNQTDAGETSTAKVDERSGMSPGENAAQDSPVTVTWETAEENFENNDERWGSGPTLKEDDIDRVSGFPAGLGCCECCHNDCVPSCCRDRCRSCCASCLAFPRHTTLNQFFTPRMFTVYHREGYSACMECDDFLAGLVTPAGAAPTVKPSSGSHNTSRKPPMEPSIAAPTTPPVKPPMEPSMKPSVTALINTSRSTYGACD